jgi:hypothetical protein
MEPVDLLELRRIDLGEGSKLRVIKQEDSYPGRSSFVSDTPVWCRADGAPEKPLFFLQITQALRGLG